MIMGKKLNKKRLSFLVLMFLILFMTVFVIFSLKNRKTKADYFDIPIIDVKEDDKTEIIEEDDHTETNEISQNKNGLIGQLSIKKHIVTLVAQDEGYDVYLPPQGANGYRYGPSIIYYDDGSMDMWCSRPGNNSTMWDYIAYRHSDDGINWSAEKTVLTPTADSKDHYSCCDPGVIYFNGYYYLGYTSTSSSYNGGSNNSAFVARSANPDGPFEKWNGQGWGGDPEPIIVYDEDPEYWGAGELSFVLKDHILYCYCSWDNKDGNFTKVFLADDSENWPNTLKEQSNAIAHIKGEDSFDVAYIEELDRFIAISVAFRYTQSANIAVYNSSDGIVFESVDNVSKMIHPYLHNIGISKKIDGHIDRMDNLLIGYAYGFSDYSTWGRWAMMLQPISLKQK